MKVLDTRYYPADAEVRTRPAPKGEQRADQPRARWLDIPAAVRAVMPPGSTWRKRRCTERGHVHHTIEFDSSILEEEA